MWQALTAADRSTLLRAFVGLSMRLSTAEASGLVVPLSVTTAAASLLSTLPENAGSAPMAVDPLDLDRGELARFRQRRAGDVVASGAFPPAADIHYLKQMAVAPSTADQYLDVMCQFLEHAREVGDSIDPTTFSPQFRAAFKEMSEASTALRAAPRGFLDDLVYDFIVTLLFNGDAGGDVEKLKEVLFHFIPLLRSSDIPQALRALPGYLRLAPTSSRFTLPPLTRAVISMWMPFMNQNRLALALVLEFLCYLRTSELMLQKKDLLGAVAGRSRDLIPPPTVSGGPTARRRGRPRTRNSTGNPAGQEASRKRRNELRRARWEAAKADSKKEIHKRPAAEAKGRIREKPALPAHRMKKKAKEAVKTMKAVRKL